MANCTKATLTAQSYTSLCEQTAQLIHVFHEDGYILRN